MKYIVKNRRIKFGETIEIPEDAIDIIRTDNGTVVNISWLEPSIG